MVLIAGLAAFVFSVVRLSGPGALAVFLFYFAGASDDYGNGQSHAAALKRRAGLKRAVEIKAGFYRDALPHSHVLSAAKKARRSAHGKGA